MNKKIKIVHVIPNLNQTNGVSSFVMNYLYNINYDKFEICVVANDFHPSLEYIDFLYKAGIKLYLVPDVKKFGILKYFLYVKNIFNDLYDFDIIHCHITNLGLFFLFFAKKRKIPIRILHAHATKSAETFLKRIRNTSIQNITKLFSNVFFACSDVAGKYLFGNTRYEVLNNAIDYEKFQYNDIYREEILARYSINVKSTVVGFSGRLCKQKNIPFLLEIINGVLQKDNTFIFFIIGDGEFEVFLHDYIKKHSLHKNIIHIPQVFDMYKYYSAFDIFLLPSLYEGLPFVGIESQVCGCTCFFSENITQEVNISNNAKFLNIDNLDNWVSHVLNYKKKVESRNSNFQQKYDIQDQVKRLESLYINLYKKQITNEGR